MKNTLKKTLSLLLALTMVLSLGLPAYALDLTEGDDIVIDELPIAPGRFSELPTDDEIVDAEEPITLGDDLDLEEFIVAPEQDFNASDVETGFSVDVHAPAGALPEGTEMRVTRLGNLEEVQAAVDRAENLDGEVRLAADISFWYEGEEIEPSEGSKLLVRMSAPEIEGIADPVVIHIPDEANAEPEIVEQIIEDGDIAIMPDSVSFEADSFSKFAVIWSGGTPANTTTNLRFRTGSNDRCIVTVHYVDQNGNPITRPSTVGTNINVALQNGVANYTIANSALTAAIAGATYQGAYMTANKTNPVDTIRGERVDAFFDYNRVSFYYNGNELTDYTDTSTIGTADGDIYLVYNRSGNSVDVYYGYMSGGSFVEFTEEQILSSNFPKDGLNKANYSNSNPYAWLEYDFKGYTYKETRRTSPTGSTISPVLRMNQTTPQYTTSTNPDNSWTNLSSGEAIYVIYEKTSYTTAVGETAGGDTPVVTPPENLPATKHVVRNDDGTYDITLSVTGKVGSATTVSRASVIVIVDTSGSMAYNINSASGNSNERMIAAKNAVYTLANTLLNLTDENTGEHLVEMALIDFNSTVNVHTFGSDGNFTTRYNTGSNSYYSEVSSLSPGGATNWEAALRAADALQCSTTAPTYIIFVTDGDPTVRMGRANETDAEIYSNAQRITYTDGSTAFAWGESLTSTSYFGLGYTYCQGHYDAAVNAGIDIREHNKKFFGIGLSSDAARVQNLVNAVYNGVDLEDEIPHYYAATSNQQIQDAFETIAQAVSDEVGYTEVTMDDGVTEFSTIELNLVEGANSYVCRRGNNQTNPEQNPVWNEGPAPEVVNSHVKWSPMGTGALEPNVTYSITFTVWPSQQAYDLIANINNCMVVNEDGTVSHYDTADDAYNAYVLIYPDLAQQIEKGSDGKYTLKTNTSFNLTYKYNGQSVEQEPTEPMQNASMPLPTETISIKKTWRNYLDAREASDVVLTLMKGDEAYVEIPMGTPEEHSTADGKEWVQEPGNEIFISMGQLTVSGSDVTVNSPGHDYQVIEPESFSYRWELYSDIYRPMVINGTPTVLIEVQDKTGLPDNIKNLEQNKTASYNGLNYYAFEGNLYVQKTGDNILEATNDRRSGLNIKKLVTGNGAPEDDTFPIQLHFYNPHDPIYTDSDYDEWNNTFWFAVQTDPTDRNTVVLDGVVVENATPEVSELRLDNTHITDIVTHQADDNYPYDYITYKYDGTEYTVKAVDLEIHTETEKVNGVEVQYQCYKYYTGFYWFDNGAQVDPVVYIKADQYICLTNLANDTEYVITELTETLYSYGYVYDHGESDTESTYIEGTPAVIDDDAHTATGTIDKANNTYSVEFTNEYKGAFYVYHTADNTIEQIFLTDPRVVDGKFNIAAETKTDVEIETTDGGTKAQKYIYGGYYESYTNAGTVAFTGENALTFEKKADTYVTKLAYADDHTGGIWATVEAGTPKAYLGDGTLFSDEYTDNGMAMTPVANTVYYLKEVPEAYLRGMIRYTYYENPALNYPIGTLWVCCATDGDYETFGILKVDSNETEEGRIVASVKMYPINGEASQAKTYNAASFLSKYNQDNKTSFAGGKVGYLKVYEKVDYATEPSTKLIDENENLCFYWVTPDGIRVTGTRQFYLTNLFAGSGKQVSGASMVMLNKAEVDSTLTPPATSTSEP